MSEIITHVAIKFKGKIYALPRPNRHHDCISLAYLEFKEYIRTESQGFLTSKNRYIDRREAMKIARNSGQLLNETETELLYSEDLW